MSSHQLDQEIAEVKSRIAADKERLLSLYKRRSALRKGNGGYKNETDRIIAESITDKARLGNTEAWSKKQLADWGVSWPPPRGWRDRLVRADLLCVPESTAAEKKLTDAARGGDDEALIEFFNSK